jgi:hypothetical protein
MTGRIVAELSDYAELRELVADLVAEGAGVSIKSEVRETVGVVKDLLTGHARGLPRAGRTATLSPR